MDKMSWVTIGIDAVVAFIVGVLGAAIAPSASAKVVNFFYARKVSRSLKQKQTELRNYERIKGFHLGTKDKQFYYVYLGTISIACFIASSTCLIATVIVDRANHDVERLVVGLLSGSIFGLLGILILVGMQYTATNLENFEGYEKRVKERWPDA